MVDIHLFYLQRTNRKELRYCKETPERKTPLGWDAVRSTDNDETQHGGEIQDQQASPRRPPPPCARGHMTPWLTVWAEKHCREQLDMRRHVQDADGQEIIKDIHHPGNGPFRWLQPGELPPSLVCTPCFILKGSHRLAALARTPQARLWLSDGPCLFPPVLCTRGFSVSVLNRL